MKRILTCISSKEILILLLLVPLMSIGMVSVSQQTQASDNNSNKISRAIDRTVDSNSENAIATSTKGSIVVDNNQLSGSGSGGVMCPNGKHVGNAEISFGGFMSNVPLYGSWEIVAVSESGNSLNQGGSLHSGNIGTDHYSLSGTQIANKICGNSSTSSNIQTTTTLSGQCGQGVTIELNANDGESGTFIGNVDCTANRSP
ncbi:MAG TPA: hypothetical protein VFI73_11050 [Candidatus Nitrosopolaris sp.]|nr:hypothetical protein [Candidatus Nitrosopolaris sp.]